MQPTRQPSPRIAEQQAPNPFRNPAPSPPAPLRPLPSAPCPHCCGEGYLITTGPGYFDLHEECWMPNDDIDPCPTCRGTGCQPNPWDQHELDITEPQAELNQDADDGDLPRLPF